MTNQITLIYNGGYKYLLEDKRHFLPIGIFQLKAYLKLNAITADIYYISQDLCGDDMLNLKMKDFFINHYVDNLVNWQQGQIDQEILHLLINKFQAKQFGSEFVGFSVMSFEDVLPTLYALKALKSINDDFITIVGGSYLSLVNKEIFEDNQDLINFMVVGDGEYALHEVIEQQGDLEKLLKTSNLLFYYHDKLIYNQSQYINFNDLALPDYQCSKQPEEIYYNFSRGCLGSCLFCIKKDKLQFKDLDLIKKELDQLINQYQPKYLYFIDSSANNNVVLLLQILDYLQNITGNFEIILWVDFYNFPDDLIEKINQYSQVKKITLKFGLESGDEKMRQYLNKPYFTNQKVEEILGRLKSEINKLSIHLNIIISIPFEKEVSLFQTLSLINRNKSKINSIGLTVFHLTPNSPIFLKPELYKVAILDKALNKYNFYYRYEEINGLKAEEVDLRNDKYFSIVTGFLDKIGLKW